MNAVDPLLKGREVCAILQISTASLYRRIADGSLPKPIKLGGVSRWSNASLQAAIEAAQEAKQ